MRRSITALVLTSVFLLQLSPSQAQRKNDKSKKPTMAALATERGADNITAAQLRDYLSFIASDELEGRDTPSPGLDTAAKFIAMSMSRWGLKPAGDDGSYFQKIALRRDLIDRALTRVQLNGLSLELGVDYIPSPRAGDVSGQLVFAGSGWLVKSRNIDGFKGVDAKGKIAIVFSSLMGLPRGVTRSDLSGKRGEDWMEPAEYARKLGAVGLIVVPDFQFLANWDVNRQRLTERGTIMVEKFQTQAVALLPTIIASPRLANILFQGEQQNATTLHERAYGGGDLPASFALSENKLVSITVTPKGEPLATQNVVAIFEGSDPVLKNEYVALGAHYDHVGINQLARGDRVYNGADDDGSGTTALIAIAEALSKARSKPKRSVLLVWHAGEEKGLWGSRYFTDYPTVPLEKIVTQINLDMIGRSKQEGDTNSRNLNLSGPNQIYIIGSRMMSTELGDLAESVNKSYLNLTYDYRYDDPADLNRFFFRSDHYNYAKKGIPIIFFFDGEHEDYHRVTDTADKIDYQKMERIARTVYMTMFELANRPTRPTIDKQLPAQLTR